MAPSQPQSLDHQRDQRQSCATQIQKRKGETYRVIHDAATDSHQTIPCAGDNQSMVNISLVQNQREDFQNPQINRTIINDS